MKNQKGVTLISLTIYIIVLLIIITIISILSSYFYKNINLNSVKENLNQQYTKFNSYFVEEINQKDNQIIEIGQTSTQKYLIFSSGNQYTYIPENESIYMNRIKIAKDITDCQFIKGEKNKKTTITVIISGNNFERTTRYTLE